MSLAERVWDAARWLYALFWIATGASMIWIVWSGRTNPIVQPTPAAQDFADAMDRWIALTVATALLWTVAGVAMLVRRTAPLGLALVAPAVFVILLFHLTLTGQYLWGVFFAAYAAALMWRCRDAYAPMWTRSADARRGLQPDPLDARVV